MNDQRTIIITGGAGFIGSHVVRLFVTKYPHYTIINLDALTYAGNLENLSDIENAPNYIFERVNILDTAKAATGKGKPICILLHTAMGKGVDFMEGTHEWHGIAPSDKQLDLALAQLPETLGDY